MYLGVPAWKDGRRGLAPGQGRELDVGHTDQVVIVVCLIVA
jgi:hypothetical protein